MRYRCRNLCVALIALMLAIGPCGANADECIWPEAGGTRVYRDGSISVDASNSPDGYLMVKGPKSDKRLKLRIKKDGMTLTYDLNGNGAYEVFPLQLGSGTYRVQLYKNTSGNKYAEIGDFSVKVTLNREDAAFLVPSQYVNYNQATPAVLKSWDLCSEEGMKKKKFELIKEYIRKNFVYDYVQAAMTATVSNSLLPDIDRCTSLHKGICQDLSAMAVCMLRVEQIPAKLVIGYANKNYHAWVEVELDGETILYDPTADVNVQYKNVTYTTERWY